MGEAAQNSGGVLISSEKWPSLGKRVWCIIRLLFCQNFKYIQRYFLQMLLVSADFSIHLNSLKLSYELPISMNFF